MQLEYTNRIHEIPQTTFSKKLKAEQYLLNIVHLIDSHTFQQYIMLSKATPILATFRKDNM